MGVTLEWKTKGTGAMPQPGQKVSVHCTGFGKNGNLNEKFWSTRKEDGGDGKPFEFVVGKGQVIKAWDEGVLQMPIGSRATLVASADYAYGAGGFPAWGIAPNSPLNFDVEVLAAN